MDGRVIHAGERIRLIVDPPQSGTRNMAVDEALLQSACQGISTLRFYSWDEPTLSLGYFQSHLSRHEHDQSAACPLVRRSSGGGAILHHHELTYSFSCPAIGIDTQRFYQAFHQSLIDFLNSVGIKARLWQQAEQTTASAEPFLCFLRRSPGDVICGDAKIAGSAQRRHRGALLQHGSVLLHNSPCAPQLSSLHEQTGIALKADELLEKWQQELAGNWHLNFDAAQLDDREAETAQQLETEKFSSVDWIRRR